MPTSVDHSQFRYENFENRPNVLIAYHLGGNASRIRFQPIVQETLRILIKKAPKNTYVLTGPQSDGEVQMVFRVIVERDDEILGTIRATYGRGGNSVEVHNDRIEKERERGGGMITSDPKRAAALALKKFLPTPPEEILVAAYQGMNAKLRDVLAKVNSAAYSRLRDHTNVVFSYVEQNWDTTGRELLVQVGIPPSSLAPLDAIIEARRAHASLNAVKDKGLTYILQNGDTLYTIPMSLDTNSAHGVKRTAFAIHDAPGDIKAGITMLKLCEEGHYIPDVGMRIGPNSFCVFFDLDNRDEEDDGDASSEGDD